MPALAMISRETFPVFVFIACFRFIMPIKEIMIAGGRTLNLRDLQCMIFQAGASALMVGNYLTTLNQPVEQDLQMLRDLGLDPDWDEFDEGALGGCGDEDSCDTVATTETTEAVTA